MAELQPVSGATTCLDYLLVSVFFEPVFYSRFGFVIDATVFTDQEGPMHEHPKCYAATDEV